MFLIAAISAYAMDNYGLVVSSATFKNIVETNSHEVLDLLNWRLMRCMVLFFILPTSLLLLTNVRYPLFRLRLVYIALCIAICLGNLLLFGKYYASMLRNHKNIIYYINPVRPIYSMVKYNIKKYFHISAHTFVELDNNPVRMVGVGKPKLVVLVVGESDRAINHQLNGYTKKTNPRLTVKKDVYSFGNFYSCGTETTISVPCMFSVFTREEYTSGKALYTENILDLLQKSNIEVLWRDNDGGCKNVCDRVKVDDFNNAKIKQYCNDFECHDEVLLHDLQAYISSSKNDKLIVLHKKGNHGPAYYKRYPAIFAQFAPICETNELHSCTNEQIINTYDNIVLYTDYFLDILIKNLEKNSDEYQTALIYVSDHGESLGENGVYLHGMPYWLAPKEQRHIPFMFWASKNFDINREQINLILQQEFSHDYLFHSLLGLFNVQSKIYIKELDMFAAS